MSLKNPSDRWGAVSQLFHWLIVALLLAMAYLGLTMTDLPNTATRRGYNLALRVGRSVRRTGPADPSQSRSAQ